MKVTASVSSMHALGGVQLDKLRSVISSYLGATHLAAPKSTLDGENSAYGAFIGCRTANTWASNRSSRTWRRCRAPTPTCTPSTRRSSPAAC
eukprot:1221331-Prymnesium_polylepis.1